MPMSPMRQTHFRWYNDNGPLTSNTPMRGEDSNLAAVAPGSHMLLRAQSQHRGDHSLAVARQLQYRKVGSNVWRQVKSFGTPPYDMPLFYPSTWFADGAAITTRRLTIPTGTTSAGFKGGQARQSETVTSTLALGSKEFS